jgi:hypothetical protein
MRVKTVAKGSPAAKAPNLADLVRDYQKATEQYGVIVRHLKDTMEVLTKSECQLLLDFAEIEKNHCERLHREIQERLATERRGALTGHERQHG